MLQQALTHESYANEVRAVGARHSTPSNERLEFLGDAVLDLLVSELLMRAHPEADEVPLSRARANAVNKQALAARARELELGRFVLLGRGERRSGGADKDSILANAFEALVGALYLDGGLAPVQGLVEREMGALLRGRDLGVGDAKTRLQEAAHALGLEAPSYRTVRASGPDHAVEFEVEVRVAAKALASGRGRSKQVAEQEAARGALPILEGRAR